MKITVGLFAMIMFPALLISKIATPGRSAHWVSVTQNPSNLLSPKCSWHLLPNAVLTSIAFQGGQDKFGHETNLY